MTLDLVQGSEDWHKARLGKVTASRLPDVMARTKTGPAAVRKNYMAQLVAERLTGVPAEQYVNAAMEWGTATEPQARAAYSFFTDAVVQEVGFVPHPSIAMSGASPDGLVGEDGLIEIKAPTTATHIETLINDAVAEKYIIQMQWQMACTGRAWCDFVSFDPRLPADLSLFIRRIKRDDTAIKIMEQEVVKFLAELDETIRALQEVKNRAAA